MNPRPFLAILLALLFATPAVLGQRGEDAAPAFCDANHDGRVSDEERRACLERCDSNRDRRISDEERMRCVRAAREHRDAPPADCRAALERATLERERMRENISARWERLREEQEARTKTFGARNHTEAEWLAFREELAAQRARAEAAVANLTEQLEVRIGRLQACAGVAAAGRIATCDAVPGDRQRFVRMVEREAADYAEGVRRRAAEALAEADTPEVRAEVEARLEGAILAHRARLEEKWHDLAAAHARACVRESAHAREAHEIQKDVRADRLGCKLQAEAVIEPFLDASGREPRNWSEADRARYRELREQAGETRAACEQELHDGWKAAIRERFNESHRRDRFGQFAVDGAGEGSGTATGRFVSFAWDREPFQLTEYSVQGVVLLESFRSPHAILDPRFHGANIDARGAQEGVFRARVHDAPSGGFEGRCAAPGCTLVLPDGATVSDGPEENGTRRYTVSIGDTRAFLFVHGEHAWTDATLALTGGWRLLAPSENFVLEKVANRHRAAIVDAVSKGHVLAEINVVADASGVAAQTIETAPVEADGAPDVEVAVAQAENAIVVDLSADAATGESVVINVEAAALGVEDLAAEDIEVTYVDVAEDGTETTVEIGPADSAADALVVDEDVPEYYVEADEDGVQVIVSNTHFSAKQLTIGARSADGSAPPAPASPAPPATPTGPAAPPAPPAEDADAPGAGLLGLLAAAAAVALVARRRR